MQVQTIKHEHPQDVATIRGGRPAWRRVVRVRGRRLLRRLHRGQEGATSLEYLLLIGVIALPTVAVLIALLELLLTYFRMGATLVSLPVT